MLSAQCYCPKLVLNKVTSPTQKSTMTEGNPLPPEGETALLPSLVGDQESAPTSGTDELQNLPEVTDEGECPDEDDNEVEVPEDKCTLPMVPEEPN